MKRILIGALLLLFVFPSVQAQTNLKKTAIIFNSNINLGDIYSVHNKQLPEANYVITKSNIEVPIAYDTINDYPAKENSHEQTDGMNSHVVASNEGIESLQSFAVFSIVNTNHLPNEVTLEDNYTIPNIKEHLPKDFNPYYGMFEDNVLSKAMQHPITAR